MTDTQHWLTARTGLVPTPPPQTRHSTTEVWDESTRPTAPEPDRETRFTGRGLSAGKHLIEVHNHYRAELTRVRDILEQVRANAMDVGVARGELNAMTLRSNNWTLGSICQSYCLSLTQHHTMESGGIFPHLRASDQGLAAVIERLDQEHQVIHDVLEAVDQALVDLVRHPEDLSGVQEAVDVLTDALLSHLAYEERELVGPLSRFGFFGGQV
ncbi:hemerythrin HHE cation binding domain-containing protein [Micromonospora pisi]|uniref:Hemerythrin HHE cation binding domain-containing protein n=1 Tax=Micromonospora pisi TaxID=589240 RepID=A0A495JFR3_9ACTN|nr:hemerythrin domain-containing protein [Micromonospora pisi]RKR87836.1 hemerythrin HHE cation binding domain-containing protein [Micromonospora pisi]